MTQLRAVSYGGGVQSTALLVLAAQGRIDYRTFLMANVGDDSEHPATLKYVRDVAIPYAREHGIDVHLLDRHKRDGSTETLYGRLMDARPCPRCAGVGKVSHSDTDDEDAGIPPNLAEPRECPRCTGSGEVQSRSLPIPVRMSNGAPGTRSCTADFKIRVIAKWLKERGAHAGKPCRLHRAEDRAAAIAAVARRPRLDCGQCVAPNPAVVAIGISVDEIGRANTRRAAAWETVVYPLVSIGDDTGLRLNRLDCERIIRDAGLPVPPKSSCYFCPFHRPSVWQDMRRDEPDLFEKSAALEDTLNERRKTLGKDPVFLTRFAIPLREAIQGDAQGVLFTEQAVGDESGTCDSGWCMT